MSARAKLGATGAPARRSAPLKLIAVGASTGGTEALVELLSAFPPGCPPTVVVQHMPAAFTRSFSERLNGLCVNEVREAWNGAPLEAGCIYVAPGGETHLEVVWGGRRTIRLVAEPPVNRHRPSVDVAFRSVAAEVGRSACGVLLTGMGRDGAEGLLAMREAGARTYAQDRETSAVYGMPRAALELGAVDVGLPVPTIAASIFPTMEKHKEALQWL